MSDAGRGVPAGATGGSPGDLVPALRHHHLARMFALAACSAFVLLLAISCGGGSGSPTPDVVLGEDSCDGATLPDPSTVAQALTAGTTDTSNLGMLKGDHPSVGDPAPDFALLDVRDGTTVRKLSDYRGKAVVLNFFASWCGPCKREIPLFQKAATDLSSDVLVLGVDYEETQKAANGILQQCGAVYPALLDDEGDVGTAYRVKGLPVSYFIDKDGIVRASQIGEVKAKTLTQDLAKLGIKYPK